MIDKKYGERLADSIMSDVIGHWRESGSSMITNFDNERDILFGRSVRGLWNQLLSNYHTSGSDLLQTRSEKALACLIRKGLDRNSIRFNGTTAHIRQPNLSYVVEKQGLGFIAFPCVSTGSGYSVKMKSILLSGEDFAEFLFDFDSIISFIPTRLDNLLLKEKSLAMQYSIICQTVNQLGEQYLSPVDISWNVGRDFTDTGVSISFSKEGLKDINETILMDHLAEIISKIPARMDKQPKLPKEDPLLDLNFFTLDDKENKWFFANFAKQNQSCALMLRRKFEPILRDFLKKSPDKILLVNGARQIGKSYIIRYVCEELFHNYVEIDLRADKESDALFANVKSTDDFYFQLGLLAGGRLGSREDTMIFLDEIQVYPHLLTMLKFLNQEKRFRYIASGSQLGIALSETPSVPMGSIESAQMYPLDFEEFLWAMGMGEDAIEEIGKKLTSGESLDESAHEYIMKQLKYYLLVGGLPEAVALFTQSRNLFNVRIVQKDIHDLYGIDVSQYDKERKLKIRRIYDMIPSNMENRKKRIIYQKIEDKKGKHFADYEDEFDYLINSGISLDVTAISNPKFPLKESESKNLIKLYLNDVGILTSILYGMNANAVLNDEKSINLGTVYESFVAQELKAHGFKLFYYDNKKKGEIEFLIDDHNKLSVMPIEVKSGKDYKVHSALDGFISTPDYHISSAVVLSNERNIELKYGILYMPIYYSMFIRETESRDLILD